jgi:membrane protease YdiL (CAAX protease family)
MRGPVGDRSTPVRPIVTFIAVASLLAIAFAFATSVTGGPHGPLGAAGFVTMLIPALSAAILRAATGEDTRIDWSRLPRRYLPVALFLIPAVMHAAMLPAMHAAAGRLPWSGHPAWPRVALNATVGLVVVSAFALFEEIGWRGWLLPRLVDRLHARLAIVLTAAIWAAWHVPFVVSGILAVSGMGTSQALGIVPLGTFGAGLIIGWLWLRTESIWIVALAHGALNDWGQFAFKYMQAAADVNLASVLLAGSVAVVVTGAVLTATLTPARPERIAR